jgi:putative endonuclease
MGLLTQLWRWWMERFRPLSASERGRKAEREAALYLRRRGYRILAQNLRTPFGEIDLVAEKDEVIAITEVKARSSEEFGTPIEALRPRQQQRLRRAGEWLIARKGWQGKTVRFDLIAVDLDEQGNVVRLEHIPDAF